MTVLELVGDSRERGRQHGEALRGQIRERAARTLGFAVGRTEQVAAPWWRAIGAACPELAAELRGIADGADRPVAEVVLLNAFEAADVAEQVELGGCTLLGAAQPGGGCVVGQNWDANDSLAATVGVHLHRGPDLPTTLVLASPGGLGWAGMNAHGLALVSSDLLTAGTAHGLPSQAVRRLMLRETGTAGALAALERTPPVGGRSYLLGDATGGPVSVELAAEQRGPTVLPAGERLAHTNHPLAARVARWEDAELREATYPSTHARLRRAAALLARGAPGADRVREILTDHDGRPLSVCRHPAPAESTVTAGTLVFDCRARVARVSIGNPCRQDGGSHRLD